MTFGGPVVKDKLHFFASQEWNRNERGTVRTALVPTAAERTGDFSGPAIRGCTARLPPHRSRSRASRSPGNRIPLNRLSPGGLLLLAALPATQHAPGAGTCNNWVTSLNTPINWREENLRVDWQPGQPPG